MTKTKECTACHRSIDAAARICPFCDSDPETGHRFDPTPIVRSHFPEKGEVTRWERLLESVRERQGLVVTAVVVAAFLLVGAAHQYIIRRSASLEGEQPAVPLTEIADLDARSASAEPPPVPDIGFPFTGKPEGAATLLIEPGAVAPPTPAAEATTQGTPAGPAARRAPRTSQPQRPAATPTPASSRPAPPSAAPAATATAPR